MLKSIILGAAALAVSLPAFADPHHKHPKIGRDAPRHAARWDDDDRDHRRDGYRHHDYGRHYYKHKHHRHHHGHYTHPHRPIVVVPPPRVYYAPAPVYLYAPPVYHAPRPVYGAPHGAVSIRFSIPF